MQTATPDLFFEEKFLTEPAPLSFWKSVSLYLSSLSSDSQVATIFPTSQQAVCHICSQIDFSKKISLIEYGPGVGVFSRFLLSRMRSDCTLILIERNRRLYNHLKQIRDPRLMVFHESAENVERVMKQAEVEEVDYVLSGIPFSRLKLKPKCKLLRSTRDILRPGGKLLVYQAFGHLTHFLDAYFEQVRVERKWRNLPPLWIAEATKGEIKDSTQALRLPQPPEHRLQVTVA